MNFLRNAGGAKRIIGDHVAEVADIEMVLVGPNLQHGWFTNKCEGKQIQEITVQFHRDLFDDRFLKRNQMSHIRTLLVSSSRGVLFSKTTANAIMPRIKNLTNKHGFDSVLELLSLLHGLSTSRNMRTLSDTCFNQELPSYNSRRVEKIMAYININFAHDVKLSDAAKIAGMTEVSLSRFFKFRTGKTFIDTLNEIRLGHASRMLIDTAESINKVAYKCGFNNMSNFNRLFKKKKDSTPREFRQYYTSTGVRTFI